MKIKITKTPPVYAYHRLRIGTVWDVVRVDERGYGYWIKSATDDPVLVTENECRVVDEEGVDL